MGWFEDQVQKRKRLDEKTFEDSFMSLAGFGLDDPNDLSEKELVENHAIKQILSYFHHPMVDFTPDITNFDSKLNYALKQCNAEYHKVELNDSFVGDSESPLLIYTLVDNIPLILFPHKDYYIYVNHKTGKKAKIKASLVNNLEMEALSFYRPLPSEKISIKEYSNIILRPVFSK